MSACTTGPSGRPSLFPGYWRSVLIPLLALGFSCREVPAKRPSNLDTVTPGSAGSTHRGNGNMSWPAYWGQDGLPARLSSRSAQKDACLSTTGSSLWMR